MRLWSVACLVFLFASLGYAFTRATSLRKVYARSPAMWPAPTVDSGVSWKELGMLPDIPSSFLHDSLRSLVDLGKVLFFDPRLSGSGKISCASCHQPALSWTDGLARSSGHEGRLNKRNSPSLQQVWFYDSLFWDGRSHSLEDQAFAPINSETEMHQEMQELPFKLRRVKGYGILFSRAFGDPSIDPDRIAGALAAFQRTIRSDKSRFDAFLSGKYDALTDNEISGLHIFRTKARCMNCHHGALFTDNRFHNNGFSGNDVGRYFVTKNEADRGKMKTPSLRDVTRTGPWMHDGSMTDLDSIILHYNTSAAVAGKDAHLQPLKLTKKERRDLVAFLHAISAPPLKMIEPVLPQ